MPGMGDLGLNMDMSQSQASESAPEDFMKWITGDEHSDNAYDLDPEQEMLQQEETLEFYRDLSVDLDEQKLNLITADLLDGIREDIDSRSEWEESYNKGIKYLGIKVEEFRDYPFQHACAAYDSTLSSSLFNFWSTAWAELFPSQGPAKSEVQGHTDEKLTQNSMKVQRWFNHYLTRIDKEYYPDSQRLLLYCGIVGCAFRKVFSDPITGRPKARFIDPQNFIVNNSCVTILSSTRLTYRESLNRKDIMLRQENGFYRDIELPNINDQSLLTDITTDNIRNITGIKESTPDKRSLFTVYEIHADLYIEELENDKNKIPKPYIVSIIESSKKILSIRRNWLEGDKYYKRIECFVQYNYLPGFGIYGIGLAQMLGSNAIALTSILRQLIDKGTLCNFPGGLMKKGLRFDKNNVLVGPSEFWAIETGSLSIKDVVMPFPYAEPSLVLKDLRAELKSDTQRIVGAAETQIADVKSDAPVGTTLANIELANRVQSSVLRSLHMSLTHEFELFFILFAEGMDEPTEFSMAGCTHTIDAQDFNESVRILPQSDPSLTTSTQRILRAEGILRIAQSAPEIHNLREAYRRMYVSLDVEDIDALLPPEIKIIPLDPISENMNALENKGIKAGLMQDHAAHKIVHTVFAEQNPDIGPAMMAHIHEHTAMEYYLKMQQLMGTQMPSIEELSSNMEIQNQIAQMAAAASEQLRQEQQAKNPGPPDANTVMLADIQAKQEAKQIDLQTATMKTETDSYKAQLNFEMEKEKLKVNTLRDEEKNSLQAELAEMKAESEEMRLQVQLILERLRIESAENLALERNELERDIADQRLQEARIKSKGSRDV